MSGAGGAPAGTGTRAPGRDRSSDVLVRPVRGRREKRAFIRLPWSIYRDDPAWVPPLLYDVKQVLDRRHPFYDHSEVELFLAWRGAAPIGRIAAIVNRAHNEFHADAVGFFGLFEVQEDAAAAAALLDAAAAWLRARGMDVARGPMNFSTNDELYSPGVLIDGFDSPPRVMMAHTPPYYARLLETAGYSKAMDLLAYDITALGAAERLGAVMRRIVERSGVRIRNIDIRRLDEEVDRIQSIYVSAWERNWGFAPISEREIRHLAKQLKPVIVPELVVIAEIEGEPIGFGLGLPDYNQALRRLNGRLFPFGLLKLLWYKRRIDTARAVTLGVRPEWRNKGLDGVLVHRLVSASAELGYFTGECSWILEDNAPMRRHLERIGGEVRKVYRVYEKGLAA